jgi:hypothetical protein
MAEKLLNREQPSAKSHQIRVNPRSEPDRCQREGFFQQVSLPQENPVDQYGVGFLPGILDDIESGITLSMLMQSF